MASEAAARLAGTQRQLDDARTEARSAAAGGEAHAKQVEELEAQQAAALRAAQQAQAQRVEQLGAQLHEASRAGQGHQHEAERLRARVAELTREAAALAEKLAAATQRAEAAEAAARQAAEAAAQQAQADKGARRSSLQAQQAAEMAQVAAEQQRDGVVAEAAELKQQLRREQEARRELQQQQTAQGQINLRELLGAIKIAVLAPCIKVNVSGGEALQAGAAQQVDFSKMRGLLEEKVLARWSSVKLLADGVDLAEGGAYAIFPELRDAMGLIQKEVTERLLVMMREAQQPAEQPPPRRR